MGGRLLGVFLRNRGAGAKNEGKQNGKGSLYYCILRVSLELSH